MFFNTARHQSRVLQHSVYMSFIIHSLPRPCDILQAEMVLADGVLIPNGHVSENSDVVSISAYLGAI